MKRAPRLYLLCLLLVAGFFGGCVTQPTATLQFVSPDASPELQQRHAVHYLFAHRMLPGIVKNEPDDIARGLASWPEIYLRRLWFELEDINVDYVNQHVEQIRAEAFEGAEADSKIYVIELPPPEFTPQAYRVAVVVPSRADRPSYYTLEKSFLIEDGSGRPDMQLQLAFFGAWDGLTHYNLGMYDVMNSQDFADLVRESLQAPFAEQIDATQDVQTQPSDETPAVPAS
ncbi:MAG: hypothetical protein Q7P63_08790 [Verrucomicrobiota bacterium JB022]|nr:hypothetical protein [Verrucomicrobiota bacterium JB022]